MTALRLQVEKAYPDDSGRCIARIDEDTFLRLQASPGDRIEISGNDTTAAIIWRADRQDWDKNMIRLDGFTRQNADIDLGESVEICNVEVTKADSITLRPPEDAGVQFGPDAVGMVKRQILKRPILEGDIVPVMGSSNHPFVGSPGQSIGLIAVATEPEGIVQIAPETSVTIQNEME